MWRNAKPISKKRLQRRQADFLVFKSYILNRLHRRYHVICIQNFSFFLSFFFISLQIPPYIVEVVHVLPLVTFPLVYFVKDEKTDDEMWVAIGVLLFRIMLGILTIFSVLRTRRENPGTLERLTRYGVAPVSASKPVEM